MLSVFYPNQRSSFTEQLMSHLVIIGNSYIDFIHLRAPLLEELRKENKDMTLMGPMCQDSETLEKLKKNNTNYVSYKINPVNLNPISNFLSFLDILIKLRSLNPDKVFLFTLKPIVYGSIASFFLKKTEVYSLNSGLGRVFTGSSIYNKFVLIFLRPLLKRAFKFNKKVFFQNNDDKDLFAKLNICHPSKSLVVNGTGIDLKKFHFSKEYKCDEPLNFLMISRLIEEKGLIYYYQAAKKIKKLFPEVNFLLLGNFCKSKSGLSPKIIDSWQEENVINYLGETDDVRPFLKKADIFVLPSFYREGIPRTCMEALATGLPIITTDVPGCRETVIDGLNGFLIKPKSTNDLQNAMMKFINYPEIIKDMSAEGRNLVENRFDIVKVNHEIVEGLR